MSNNMEMVCVAAAAGAREAYVNRAALPGNIKRAALRAVNGAERWLYERRGYIFSALLGSIATLLLIRAVVPPLVAEPVETARREPVTVEEMQREAEATVVRAQGVEEEALREREAEAMARVLYGTAQRCSDEARAAVCWCIINRAENALFPDSVEGVCNQEAQWMGYAADNPVVEDLYQTARGVVDAWHEGGRRLIGTDFLYMSWEGSAITLRTTFTEGASTRYWHG